MNGLSSLGKMFAFCGALWGLELVASELMTQPQLRIVRGFSDADLLAPGGMWLLDALREQLPVLSRSLLETLAWWLALLPLSLAMTLGLFRASIAPRDVQGGLTLTAALRFMGLTLARACVQGTLLLLLGLAVYACLRSGSSLRLELCLGLCCLWLVGRAPAEVYFDLARAGLASGQPTLRLAHRGAAARIKARAAPLLSSRALLGPTGVLLSAVLLRGAESASLDAPLRMGLHLSGVHLSLLLSHVLRAFWLRWAYRFRGPSSEDR